MPNHFIIHGSQAFLLLPESHKIHKNYLPEVAKLIFQFGLPANSTLPCSQEVQIPTRKDDSQLALGPEQNGPCRGFSKATRCIPTSMSTFGAYWDGIPICYLRNNPIAGNTADVLKTVKMFKCVFSVHGCYTRNEQF